MTKKAVILGANGFVGGEFAQQLLEDDYTVTSISRTGEPVGNDAWHRKVDWKIGNALSKGFWTQYLKDADVVIDTIGEWREDPNENLTFEKVNYESAVNIANAAEENKVPVFVYFSVDDIPNANKRYIQTKRDAEEDIKKRSFRHVILRPATMVSDDDAVDSDAPHRSLPVSMVVLAALDAVDNAKESVTLGIEDIDQ
ncbi:NAD-dependent epimerase/dehydratase family protein [Companilactobacillus sp. HBUAS56275]|jgi:Nucleoside-diphosphate-sugar epimerases|uniref:NAD(P)H-binding protein n=1 Tax=Candidatus Companilactobacillus pullicola TaxID=2838523 RepID=A0A9D1ZL83_9LACO|nr:NAD(P)H-binding protein [Candidatus Companilactobacillus pullicola]